MKEIEIDGTISAISEALIEHAGDFQTIWFRGQGDYAYKLLPSLFRQGKEFGVKFNEPAMFQEFKRRSHEKSKNHNNTYDWLTLMQHYGLPTRLLDWSTNLLVALYFCCISNKDKDGALFVLNPTYFSRDFKLNELMEMQIVEENRSDFYRRLLFRMGSTFDDNSLLNDIKFSDIKKYLHIQNRFTGLSIGSNEPLKNICLYQPLENTVDHNGEPMTGVYQDVLRAFSNIVPFTPPHLNDRIRQQHGCFTLHGGMYIDGEPFIEVSALEEHTYSENALIKIKISCADKERLLRELEFSGIREATLFPEMEYQAKEITSLYSSGITS
ncbi:FRG domain-containing protein [Vibrio vulnificus]|uniref:FRG domain-containing protein n=1 Tax=Vibrio vulnificus TaxID=672 RepID=UPI001CDCD465|nr:FRG domain-containing protein [Vibrio vulnificus]EGQ9313367.1 FRG domain-containing protein [Vibrio vulnificus]EHK8987123.1 FRG domain-containing protein [Vibrio vulnificus]ELP6123755.1 FRG domain-containing protein [Vibrio vulnificus]MCA3929092.1 FRG domain-containing protein [Vibrio vulnificus]